MRLVLVVLAIFIPHALPLALNPRQSRPNLPKTTQTRRALIASSTSLLLPFLPSPASAEASEISYLPSARPWSYRVIGDVPPPTLEPFQEGSLASTYAQTTPLYKAVASSPRFVRVGVPDEALDSSSNREAVLKGLVDSLAGRKVYLDGGASSEALLKSLKSAFPSATVIGPSSSPPSQSIIDEVDKTLASKDGSYKYTPFAPSPQEFNDVYLASVMSRLYTDGPGVNTTSFSSFLAAEMSYVRNLESALGGPSGAARSVLIGPMKRAAFPSTNLSRSPYSVSFNSATVLVDPSPLETLSTSPRLRLGVGLQPRYIKRNEEWRGRKVADYLLYSNNPPMVHLANTKVNFAAGF